MAEKVSNINFKIINLREKGKKLNKEGNVIIVLVFIE